MLWKQILGVFNSRCSFLKLSCLQNNLRILITTCQTPHRWERHTTKGPNRAEIWAKSLNQRALEWRLPTCCEFTRFMLSQPFRVPSSDPYTANPLNIFLLCRSYVLKYQSTPHWSSGSPVNTNPGGCFQTLHSTLACEYACASAPACFYLFTPYHHPLTCKLTLQS